MKYTDSHEWYAQEGNRAKIGITQSALKELGEIVNVELPKIGTHLESGEEAIVLESTKAAADVHTPLPGKVIAINEALLTDTTSLNEHPETNGWLIEIETP